MKMFLLGAFVWANVASAGCLDNPIFQGLARAIWPANHSIGKLIDARFRGAIPEAIIYTQYHRGFTVYQLKNSEELANAVADGLSQFKIEVGLGFWQSVGKPAGARYVDVDGKTTALSLLTDTQAFIETIAFEGKGKVRLDFVPNRERHTSSSTWYAPSGDQMLETVLKHLVAKGIDRAIVDKNLNEIFRDFSKALQVSVTLDWNLLEGRNKDKLRSLLDCIHETVSRPYELHYPSREG